MTSLYVRPTEKERRKKKITIEAMTTTTTAHGAPMCDFEPKNYGWKPNFQTFPYAFIVQHSICLFIYSNFFSAHSFVHSFAAQFICISLERWTDLFFLRFLCPYWFTLSSLILIDDIYWMCMASCALANIAFKTVSFSQFSPPTDSSTNALFQFSMIVECQNMTTHIWTSSSRWRGSGR